MKKRNKEAKTKKDMELIKFLAIDIMCRNNWSVQTLIKELGVKGAFNPTSSQSPKQS